MQPARSLSLSCL